MRTFPRQVELSKQHLPLSLPCRDACRGRCWSLFAGSILICPHMPGRKKPGTPSPHLARWGEGAGQAPPPVKESLRLNSICIVNYPFSPSKRQPDFDPNVTFLKLQGRTAWKRCSRPTLDSTFNAHGRLSTAPRSVELMMCNLPISKLPPLR